MSYAEHGAQIFLPRKIHNGRGDELVVKHSGCRLKMHDSCTDLRAWSPNQQDYIRYFRELTENEPICTKVTESNLLLNVLVDAETKSELEQLRQELAKYKALELTTEQKQQLSQSDLDRALAKGDWSLINCIFEQIQKLQNYKETLLGTVFDSAVKIEEISEDDHKHNFTIPSVKVQEDSKNKFEIKSTTESLSNIARKGSTSSSQSTSCIQSEINKNDETDLSSELERSDTDNGSFEFNLKSTIDHDEVDDNDDSCSDSDSPILDTETIESGRLEKSQSMTITLEDDLTAKNTQLEELTNSFRITLKERELQINHLQDHLTRTQAQLHELMEERDCELEEWRSKLANGRILIDQVNKKLEEKRQQCAAQAKEIEILRQDANDVEYLHAERDALVKKLEEVSKLVKDAGNYGGGLDGMKAMIRERNELIDLKKNYELHCLDQDDEIDRLSKLINHIQIENEKQRIEMNRVIDELRSELEKKNLKIEKYREEITSRVSVKSNENVNNDNALHRDELTDELLDRGLECLIKKSTVKIKQFSVALKGAADEIDKRKCEIEKLQKEMEERSRDFCDQMNKKINEGKFYFNLYEEYREKYEKLENENEELRKIKYEYMNDSQLVNDWTKIIHEKGLKIHALQKENYKLTNDIETLKSNVNTQSERIRTLERENEKLLNNINKSGGELVAKNSIIDSLKGENRNLLKQLNDNKYIIVSLREQIESLNHRDDEINEMKFVQKQIETLERENHDLAETIINLRHDVDNYRSTYKMLEENLTNISQQKVTLEKKISVITEGISSLSNDLKDNIFTEGHLMNLPEKICGSIGMLKKRLRFTETDVNGENELVDNVHETVKNNHCHKNSHFNYLENNIQTVVDNSSDELKSKDQLIKLLMKKNDDLTVKIDGERLIHKTEMEKLKQEYTAQLKASYIDFNENVKRLAAQQLSGESGLINDTFLSPLNIKINNQLYGPELLDRLSLEKDVEDYSHVKDDIAIEHRRNVIFFKHNNENKAKQRYVQQESSMKSENSSCKQFIRNCSERRSNETD